MQRTVAAESCRGSVAILVLAVLLLAAWVVVTDRSDARTAPDAPAQAVDLSSTALALPENGDDGSRIFAKYEGIDGESIDEAHVGWI